jgi:hypothetical protein
VRRFVVAFIAACSSSSAGPADAPAFDASAEGAPSDAAVVDDRKDASSSPTGSTVEGSVVFVDARGATSTSVILAPAGFDPDKLHERAPDGPKVSGIDGAWRLENVAAGTYVVLAGFENDGLVLDPRTKPPTIVVSGDPKDTVSVPAQTLVGALRIVTITPKSAEASVTIADEADEDGYAFSLLDMTSTVVASEERSGSTGVAEVTFAIGKNLAVPLKYRARVQAKKGGVVTTEAEPLRGVFTAAPDET